jgi:hypothetical protein
MALPTREEMMARVKQKRQERKAELAAQRQFVVQHRAPHMKIDGSRIVGIAQEDVDRWRSLYPTLNLELSLQEALDWCLEHGAQPRSVDLFLERWLHRDMYGFRD